MALLSPIQVMMRVLWLGGALITQPLAAFASIHAIPSSLSAEVLSESVPLAFAPNDQVAEDFIIEWKGPSIPGVTLKIAPDSLEWVRASEVLVLPRGRLIAQFDHVNSGRISQGSFHQSLVPNLGGGATAELPVALIGGGHNPVRIDVLQGSEWIHAEAVIRFAPKDVAHGGVYSDPSCSPLHVEALQIQLQPDSWILLGCRLVAVQGQDGRTSSLELFVFWEGADAQIEVGGVPAEPVAENLWTLRLRSEPGSVRLKSGADEISVSYRIAKKLHYGFLGAGIGPYVYTFNGPEGSLDTVAPLATIYGSYFFSEGLRLVAFDAMPLHSRFYNDFGMYLNTQSFIGLDRRFIMNLMLGAHVITFKSKGELQNLFGGPQGVEFVFRDFLAKNRNLAAGAFVYPRINDKAYYNLWLRWGSPALFGELNYIAFREMLDSDPVYSRSVGISVGIPLFGFL